MLVISATSLQGALETLQIAHDVLEFAVIGDSERWSQLVYSAHEIILELASGRAAADLGLWVMVVLHCPSLTGGLRRKGFTFEG